MYSQINFTPTSRAPAQLDNAVLGSEKDGKYIKLPSFSALKSQLGDYKTIIAQVCACHHHVYHLMLHATIYLTKPFSLIDVYVRRESTSVS